MITKLHLAKELRKADIPYRTAFLCLDLLLQSMSDALSKNEKIELRGFGSFSVRKTAEHRTGINGSMAIPQHGRVVFRPCEELRKAAWNNEKAE